MNGVSRSDLAVGVLVAALMAWEVLASDVAGPPAVLVTSALVSGLALAGRRRAPLAAIAVSMAGALVLVTVATTQEPQAPIVAMLVAAYGAGAHAGTRGGVAGLALVLATILLDEADNIVVLGPVCTGAFAAGRLWRARERDARRMAELATALDRERVEEGRLAVAEERARIARELHDVVAHAMTTIVLEAGAERLHLAPGQERTGATLRGIERTGREALTEMRRLLDVLREDDHQPALSPQPSLDRLADLVENLRSAGLEVDLRVEGRPIPLPPGLDVNAYRIVQEALTNVLKHAGAASASVVVGYAGTELRLEVTDDGVGPDGGDRAAGNGHGHGLTGLRERATLFGGQLEAGPQARGGFAVRARLPIPAERA